MVETSPPEGPTAGPPDPFPDAPHDGTAIRYWTAYHPFGPGEVVWWSKLTHASFGMTHWWRNRRAFMFIDPEIVVRWEYDDAGPSQV